MTALFRVPVLVLNSLVVAILIIGIFSNEIKVLAVDGTSSAEIQTEQISSGFKETENHNELPANRVLPVDAEHKSKITFPQQALDPICIQNLRENLVKFLKRVKSGKIRQGRQDDGDDGDDGEEGGGLAGVLSGLGEGNGALGVLSSLPAVVPQFVSALTQVSGAINQGLNGTDTPNLPSFIVKHGSQLIQAFTGQQSARPTPTDIHVERVPGAVPVRRPRPPANYEYLPEDYDEYVKQPLQPTLRPLRPEDIGRPRPSNYDPYPGNPNYGEYPEIPAIAQSTEPPPLPVTEPDNSGLPSKTSLWNIYKSIRTKSPGNSTLTDFQLAHPAAFSNELLQSISQSISGVRGQSPNGVVPTNAPPSAADVFKMFYPERPQINSLNRPTLSVYKPGSSLNSINGDGDDGVLEGNKVEPQKLPGETSYNQELKESYQPPQQQQQPQEPSIQQELDSGIADSEPGQRRPVPGQAQVPPGFGLELNGKPKPVYNINKNSLVTTGSLAQLHAQQQSQAINTQYINAPNSILTLPNGPNKVYIPAVSSLHEDDKLQSIGPQTNSEDTKNGFTNKAPYRPIVNGVLLEAPRLTPAPQFALKPPSNLFIGGPGEEALKLSSSQTTTKAPPLPGFSFQANKLVSGGAGPGLIPPGATMPNRVQGNGNRAPLVSAAISSAFNSQFVQNPLETNGVLPPSLLPQIQQIPQSESGGTPQKGVAPSQSQQEENEKQQPEGEIASPGRPSPGFASSLTSLAASSSPYRPGSPNTAGNLGNSHVAPESNQGAAPGGISNNPLAQQDTKLLQYLLANYPHLLGLNINPNLAPAPATPQNPQSANSNGNETYFIPEFIEPIPAEVSTTPAQPSAPPPSSAHYPASTSIAVDNEKEAPPLPPPLTPQRKPILYPQLSQPSPNRKPGGNRRPAPDVPHSTDEVKNNAALPTGILNEGPIGILSSNWNIHGLAQTAAVKPTTPHPYGQNNLQSSNFGGLLVSNSGLSPSSSNIDKYKESEVAVSSSTAKYSGGHLGGINFASPIQFPSAVVESPDFNPPPPLPSSTNSPVSITAPEATKEAVSGNFGDLSQLYGNVNPLPVGSTLIREEAATTPAPPPRTSTSSSFSVSVVENLPSIVFPALEGNKISSSFSSLSNPNPADALSSNIIPPLPPPLSGPTRAPTLANVDLSAFQGPTHIGGYPAYVPISTGAGLQGQSFGSSSSGDKQSSSLPQNQANSDQRFTTSLGNSAIAEMSKLPFFQEDSFRPSALPPYLLGGDKEEDSFEKIAPVSESGSNPISEIFSVVTSTIKDDPAEGGESTSSGEEQKIPDFPPGKPIFWMNMYYPNGIPVLTKVRTTTLEPPTTLKPKRRRKSTTTPPPTSTTAPEYYEDDNEAGGGKHHPNMRKVKKEIDFVTD